MSESKKEKDVKESLELMGIKISSGLKDAIEKESDSLQIKPGTYARQLLILGWKSRHEAPVAKNPREQILIDRFSELPIDQQEDVVAIVETLYKKYVEDMEVEKLLKGKPLVTQMDKSN